MHTNYAPTKAGYFQSALQDGINESHGKYAGYSLIILIRFKNYFRRICVHPSFSYVVRTYILISFSVLYPHCYIQTSILDRAAIFHIWASTSILHTANIYFSVHVTSTMLFYCCYYCMFFKKFSLLLVNSSLDWLPVKYSLLKLASTFIFLPESF